MDNLNNLLHHYIPGGCHTYSKGTDQYLLQQVPTAVKSQGAWVHSVENKRYLDWCMGNRVICLGHSHQYVNKKVIRELQRGTNHTFPSILELQAAKYFVDELGLGEMVKFGKNGSDAVSAAIRLSRAYTGRSKVVICADQPFYSIHDWFIGSTASSSGVDLNTQVNVIKFEWNNIDSLREVIRKSSENIACLLLEVCKFDPPSPEFIEYLHTLQSKYGILLIADENINCMKFGIQGAHHFFNLRADLICYGKAISNGFSFSMLAGPRKIMDYGGTRSNLPKVFLLSQTHSSESTGIAAAMATCEYYLKNNVEKHIANIGCLLKKEVNELLGNSFLASKIYLGGLDQNPTWVTTLENDLNNLRLRSWLVKHMMNKKILVSWFTITHSHTPRHVKLTCDALQSLIKDSNETDYLSIPVDQLPQPVFRKFQHWRRSYDESY